MALTIFMKKSADKSAQQTTDTEEIEKLTKQIAELKQQLEEVTGSWKRALADYQNLEKRTQEEKNDFIKYAAKTFILALLGVVDDFEKAQAHLKDQGLELALKKLFDLLKGESVERLATVGKDFDIHSMEAISTVEGEADNKVVEELRTGYTMHGSVLRPAQVKVSKKKS